MIITLPNGLVDGVDHFDRVQIDEIRGKQQNYLADKDLVIGNIGHVPKILEDCIVSLQTAQGLTWGGDKRELIYKLPSADLETILVKIRENTYGPRFYYESECTHCGHVNKDLRLDLDKLELDKMPVEELMDVQKRTHKLPKSGQEVEFKPLYLKDLFEIIKVASGKTDQVITATVSLSLKRIGDNSKVTAKDLEQMSAVDIAFINEKAMEIKLEGSMDTKITTECEKCKKEFESKLNPYDPAFFGPSKGYRTTST